jgi:hypothetical protein
MAYRTIAIHPERRELPLRAPLLLGDTARLQRLVGALQSTLDAQIGLREPAGAWLRELRLGGDEAGLSLAPGLPYCGHELAQAAFEALRRLLPDTDIYVRTAAQ